MNAGACCCFDEGTLANRCRCRADPSFHDVLVVVVVVVDRQKSKEA